MTNSDLYQKSIDLILANQPDSGGYIACPDFPTYRYSWFRDGAYISHAMNMAGEKDSALAFHVWAAGMVVKRREALLEAVRLAEAGLTVPDQLHLHTRYTLEGNEGTMNWENFQLDGLGTWLWSLGMYSRSHRGEIPPVCREAAGILTVYLEAFWSYPCFDCWEEFRDKIHVYTLSCIYGGLKTAREEWGTGSESVCREITRRVREKGMLNGRLCKFEGSDLVDASLIGAAVPNFLFLPGDPVMEKTTGLIEADLLREGGVHRYKEDTYYGGGIWLLLRGWLGLYHLRAGRVAQAEAALEWMHSQADNQGRLPEQTHGHLWEPRMKPDWEKKWGPSATPLLWSHAMYIWLYLELRMEDHP